MNRKVSYRIKFGKRYKKDIKRLTKSNVDLSPLEEIIDRLAAGEILEPKYRDHALKGKMQDTRECHIGSDWLLRYAKHDDELLLLLISTGDHRHVLNME